MQALDYSNRVQDTHPHLSQIFSFSRGIIFLGTPHRGSDITSIAGVVASFAQVALQNPHLDLIRDQTLEARGGACRSAMFTRSDITKERNGITDHMGTQLAKSDMLGCSTLQTSPSVSEPTLWFCTCNMTSFKTADKIPKFWEQPLGVQFRVLSVFQVLF